MLVNYSLVPSLVFLFIHSIHCQDTIGLGNGYLNFTIPNWDVKIIKDSQLLASLKPSGSNFDFSPFDYLQYRAADGQYHLGDINLRYRVQGSTTWLDVRTATARENITAVNPATLGPNVLAASDLAPTLPSDIPFTVLRQWIQVGDNLGLIFNLTNTGSQPLQIGAAGFPIEFNSIFTNRDNINQVCSFTDSSINLDAGYLRVAPLSGSGAALAVTAIGSTPLEAWNFLNEEEDGPLYYQSQVFEGFYEWQTHSLAYAEQEWAGVKPWNPATSQTLAKSKSVVWGLQFNKATSIQTVEQTVTAASIPHVVSVPGYIVPMDLEAKLFFTSPSAIKSITSDPVHAVTVLEAQSNATYILTPTGSAWGRVRVTIKYVNGQEHTLHYYITKSAPEAVADLGNFLTTKQWYTNTSDPFHRAPSVISYDNSVDAMVLQDERAWIAGLSDEGGAGSWLAATVKQVSHPVAAEVAKLDQYMMQTVHGVLQPTNSSDPNSVRKSVFFYQPDLVTGYVYNNSIDWSNWWSWNQAEAYAVDRAYDYVHVSAAWWAMYRVARDYPSLKLSQPYQFYLDQSYETAMRALLIVNGSFYTGYALEGLMGETVWGELLADMHREGNTTAASNLEAVLKLRTEFWNTLADPFGSEQAWDCTGQEGVYYWSTYFGFTATAQKTIRSIFGYMPVISHWGWNGNARRYWDFIYAGKLMRYERQIHHYGSGLNALPMLAHFRQSPTDFIALRTGYGGMNGPLTNIERSGASHAAFHSFPDTLAWDAYTGDYGPNFSGLSMGSAVYVASDPSVGGLVAFGANYDVDGRRINVYPRDAMRQRVFVGPMGLLIQISAGAIEEAIVDLVADTVTLTLVNRASAASAAAKHGVVWLSDGIVVANGTASPYMVLGEYPVVRGGSQITLGASGVQITISK